MELVRPTPMINRNQLANVPMASWANFAVRLSAFLSHIVNSQVPLLPEDPKRRKKRMADSTPITTFTDMQISGDTIFATGFKTTTDSEFSTFVSRFSYSSSAVVLDWQVWFNEGSSSAVLPAIRLSDQG